MKTKNIMLLAIAMMMAIVTNDIKAETSAQSQSTITTLWHPGMGMFARWKAKKIKRQLIKREMKRRWLSPRHRGITIVI